MDFWKKILEHLNGGSSLALLVVLESVGSSPGRQGFRMMVSGEGEMYGTVGGGIMEQKMVELARWKLQQGEFAPFKRRQVHRAEAEKERSGMICSGEQTLAFYFLDKGQAPLIQTIIKDASKVLVYENHGLSLEEGDTASERFHLKALSENEWRLQEQLRFTNTAFIFGGGHVGLAMSRCMAQLGFRVVLFDDRKGLNTVAQNTYADEIKIIKYEQAEQYVPEGSSSYVIVMTFGYRLDEVIMRRLLGRKFKYFGLMGSQHKIDVMWEKLRADGFSEEDLQAVHSPIGIPIHSKTTEEIAISVAAEIIRVKNSG